MFDWSIPSPNHMRDVDQKIDVAQLMTAMDSQVTNEELDELFHIIAKLKANEATPYFDEATLKLMWKELVVRHGDSIRLTNKGRKQIRLAISGDLAK